MLDYIRSYRFSPGDVPKVVRTGDDNIAYIYDCRHIIVPPRRTTASVGLAELFQPTSSNPARP